MTYFLRRLPLSRLLLAGGLALVLGISATALAFSLGTGPTPPAKPLADAVHGALAAPPVEGVSARIQLTDHLLEGASLAGGSGGTAGRLSSSPLLSGASGRLWIAKDGRVRLELQAEQGDTQILYDGHAVSLYDASSNTLYRYTIPPHQAGTEKMAPGGSTGAGDSESLDRTTDHKVPTVPEIEAAISHLSTHANVSGATPTDIAGQAAYTVHISPKEGGSLIGGAELSFDAVHGAPLRAAVYSSGSSSPVLELAATEISYGPVDDSVFAFKPPADAKVQEVAAPGANAGDGQAGPTGQHPTVTTHGHGISAVTVIAGKTTDSGTTGSSPALPEGLQKVKIDGIDATELPTQLGTLLSFERAGVRYLLVGAVGPAAVEAVANGL